MRIDRLEIENFKKFEKLSFDLHPRFTLLVGENGSGKTSLLDALSVAAGIWLVEPPDSMLANSETFLWPDRDNTLLAFRYGEGGFVELQPDLPPTVADRAAALRDLIGLDRHRFGATGAHPAPRDKRWKDREQIWQTATLQKERLIRFPATIRPSVRQIILDVAEGFGFFSVWMTVFADDPEFCNGLVARMQGTPPDCFDANGRPVRRPGGRN